MRADLLDSAGAERQISRRSVPFGDVGEHGSYYFAPSIEDMAAMAGEREAS